MRTFVIHPDRLKERGEHIDRMMKRLGMDYEFVNEGHDEQHIQALLDQYMKDGREQLHRKIPRALCTLSHFLAYEHIVAEGLEGALVLEDDIALDNTFLPLFEQSLKEYRELEAEYGSGTPIMVFTDSEVVDSELNLISRSMFRYQNLDVHAMTLNRLIVQNVPSGNTMLVNRALVDLASPVPSAAVMHDHWLTLVAATMGKIGFLAEPTVSYRQHTDNFYGAASYSIPAFLHKLSYGREKIRRRFQQNIDQAVEFGRRYADSLSRKDREMLEDLASFQTLGFWGRKN